MSDFDVNRLVSPENIGKTIELLCDSVEIRNDLLARALCYVEDAAQMHDDISRHAPLPPEAQAMHDQRNPARELLEAIKKVLGIRTKEAFVYPSGFRVGDLVKIKFSNLERKYNSMIGLGVGDLAVVLEPPNIEGWPADAVQVRIRTGEGALDAHLLKRVS